MTEPNLPVSQEDREAAAEVLSAMGFSQVTDQDTRAGLRDHWLPVQAFAAHRQRAIAQADAAGYRRGVEEAAPWTPPEEAWGGLARDLVMWLATEPRTPRALFLHLKRCGREIPQWLRDEPEMQQLDHVPSKGTRAVLIYRAMLDAIRALAEPKG